MAHRLPLAWLSSVAALAMGCSPSPPASAPEAPAPASRVRAPSREPGGATERRLALTIVYDNTTQSDRLVAAHGFAAIVDYAGHRILFDTGADGPGLLSNLKTLAIEPTTIESIVLSHEHDDHTSGLLPLLATGIQPTVYAPATFDGAFKSRIRERTKLVETQQATEIVPGVHLTRPIGGITEQGLVVELADGIAVITGCGHPGLIAMVDEAHRIVAGKIALLAGGFHLLGSDAQQIRALAGSLRSRGVERVLPAHCSGTAAGAIFERELGTAALAGGAGATAVLR
jgi:7,8-dihydropterin-6-yl-methyl-4-(beta-D-ribofuranosyl)aminobenzene 5'-phosphate synthase